MFVTFTVYLSESGTDGGSVEINSELVEQLSQGSTPGTTMISKESGKMVEVRGTVQEVEAKLKAS